MLGIFAVAGFAARTPRANREWRCEAFIGAHFRQKAHQNADICG
jgi:hypothetical protein